MAFVKQFDLKLYVPENWEVAADMVERWANNLKAAAETMNDRRQAKIPDDGTFIKVMAQRANQDWRPLLNPSFTAKSDRTASDVGNAHATNIVTSFNRWNDKINKAFETKDGIVAKDFKERVDASKDRWALQVGSKSLRLTGDKIRGRGVAPIVSFYMVGDPRAKAWLKESYSGGGEPYNIARDGERVALKAALQQRIVQGGQMIINSEFNPGIITNQNTVNTSLLNGFRDVGKCDAFVLTPAVDKCYCVWALDNTFLYLDVQVGLTT